MAVADVTSIICLKDITNTFERLCKSQTYGGFLQCNDGKLKVAVGFKCVFVVDEIKSGLHSV